MCLHVIISVRVHVCTHVRVCSYISARVSISVCAGKNERWKGHFLVRKLLCNQITLARSVRVENGKKLLTTLRVKDLRLEATYFNQSFLSFRWADED